jgi:hypothetical protein
MLLETVLISIEVFCREVTVICKKRGEVFCLLSFKPHDHLNVSCKQDIANKL